MNLRTRAIYLLIIEVGLVLVLVGIYPLMSKEIFDSGGDPLFGFGILMCLALGIAWCMIDLYKISKGTAKPFARVNNGQTEFTVIKLIKRQPTFVLSVLFTIIFPLLFLTIIAVGFSTGWTLIFLEDFDRITEVYVGWTAVFLPFFGVAFVIFFLQTVGFLITGESLQQHLTEGHDNFFLHIIKGVIIALPYVVLYSFVFIIMMFLHGKNSKERTAGLRTTIGSLSIFFGLQALKYFIYANLSSIAFEDKYSYTTLKDSAQYMKGNAASLPSVFTNSAWLSMVAFLYLLVLIVWASKTSFLSEGEIVMFSLAFTAVIVAWMTFVEQVLFLLNYVRVQHPECDMSSLLEDKSSNQDSQILMSEVSMKS